MFRSTGSYEPDRLKQYARTKTELFRSTGSYEPDLYAVGIHSGIRSFDPQALTSLTYSISLKAVRATCFDPQALTSLTANILQYVLWLARFRSTGSYEPDHQQQKSVNIVKVFRSTGSYEPDQSIRMIINAFFMFRSTGSYEPDREKHWFITWICGFDPQALTSLTQVAAVPGIQQAVSIHRLLRA